MHPQKHAEMSSKRNGGDWIIYWNLHHFIDYTKITFADLRHRAVRHNQEYMEHICNKFASRVAGLMPLIEGADVRREYEAHIIEDLGFVPTMEKWSNAIEFEDWMNRFDPNEDYPSMISGRVVPLVAAQEVFDCLNVFNTDDPRSGYVRHHSFGIYDIEQELGIRLHNTPTRMIAEKLLLKMYGHIPGVHSWLSRMNIEPWMRSR